MGGPTPGQILTREAFEDAAATVLALGGPTNALIHLIAMAGRCGVPLTLDDFDAIARRVPALANIRPGGAYLMEDFYYAGGLPALLAELATVPRRPAHRPPDRVRRELGQNWPPPPCGILMRRDRPRSGPCPPKAGRRCCAATSPRTAP